MMVIYIYANVFGCQRNGYFDKLSSYSPMCTWPGRVASVVHCGNIWVNFETKEN